MPVKILPKHPTGRLRQWFLDITCMRSGLYGIRNAARSRWSCPTWCAGTWLWQEQVRLSGARHEWTRADRTETIEMQVRVYTMALQGYKLQITA